MKISKHWRSNNLFTHDSMLKKLLLIKNILFYICQRVLIPMFQSTFCAALSWEKQNGTQMTTLLARVTMPAPARAPLITGVGLMCLVGIRGKSSMPNPCRLPSRCSFDGFAGIG